MLEFIEKVFKTVRHFAKKWQKDIRQKITPIVKPSLKRPIFIVGCSRAGTTLVYKTFSKSTELGSLQKETHGFWSTLHPPSERGWDTHKIPVSAASQSDKDVVSNMFYRETGKERIVDKNNQNGLSIPYLYRLFPDAHFVFIKRNPGDNINSLIVGWGKSSEFGGWADELPVPVRVENGNYNRWCFFLTDGWRDYTQSSIAEVCTFQYEMMNRAILNAKKQVPEQQWHEIKYEALIENPVTEFERLFKECEISFDGKVRTHCEEVLNKPYNTFSKIEVNKWKKGENSTTIGAALPKISCLLKELGY